MTRIFVPLIFVFLLACKEKDIKHSNDARELNEEQKRLPENALASLKVGEGMEVQLFASEPMVTNPTNISVDEKGRVWVCEAYNYDVPPEQSDKKGDRIIVLEDTDHDGKADKRTVFYQGNDITTPLGILAIDNKVYISRSPNLLVFTDTNGDLVADERDTLFTNMGKKGDHSAHAMIPGPDGRFYFSTGNQAGDIQDKNGNQIVDKAGFAVTQKGKPYLGGMVLRFEENGPNFEVLGHNFRNNYEPCIDSYGNIWQSDNDDDGNESCRINFVMPYGNYGYLDEMTKASWPSNRINIEETIPERHWHQNDPGSIPNVLITGAGSPAGMAFYEGELLPKHFWNTIIHAEPYYNVVRAYIPGKEGAGYTLEIKDILKSEDQWFRPVDVSVAPDGSLIVADWYDPILGGGAAGDATKGRIFRVAKDAHSYTVNQSNISSIEGAGEALKNPNLETRFRAFQQLRNAGEAALPILQALWKSDQQVLRARALWLLASYENNDLVLRTALKDKNPDIRILAIKAVVQHKKNILPYLTDVIKDPDAGVRREIATALRYSNTTEAAALWVDLAEQYDGKDRWYLEALGIGADLHADLFFNTWLATVKPNLKNKVHQDIIWRSRSSNALPLLAALIRESTELNSTLRYFRAFDFHNSKAKTNVLSSLISLPGKRGKEISALALRQMDGNEVKITPELKRALEDALEETKGTVSFVNLVEKFHIHDKKKELLNLAIQHGSDDVGAASTDLLLKLGERKMIEDALMRNDSTAISLLHSIKGKGSQDCINLIVPVILDSTRALSVRQIAVQMLGSSWPGEDKLLTLVKSSKFPKDLKQPAASVLFNVYRSSIQREAASYLSKPTMKGSTLPSTKQLLASKGNIRNGKTIFSSYCTPCHKVKDEGIKFGPELTQIGDKLSKEGIYRAILYPDEGVSFGYESTLITLKDGTQSMGIIASETDANVALSLPGGSSVAFSKDEVKNQSKGDKSLMPALVNAMTTQELVDLVEYLSSLKK